VEKKKIFIWIALVAIIAVLVFQILINGKNKDKDVAIDKDFSHVEVESENSDIEFMNIDGKEALIELENDDKNRYKLDVKVKGNTLEIDVERKGFSWFSFDFFSKSPKVTIGLPNKDYGTIKAETDNGTIDVSKIKVNELEADTDNGEMIIKEIESQRIDVESDNGDVVIENSIGVIQGKTNNGNVTVTMDTIEQPMDLETDNGQIHLQTKDKAKNVQFNVKTDNGRVNIYGQTTTEKAIGDGNIKIQLTSDNGNITVE